ncbi:MAG: ATP-binding SpoIIE family protein phosphatase [Nocardioidaceae bacterium]
MTGRGRGLDAPVLAEDVAWIRVGDDTAPGTVRRRAVEIAEQVALDVTRTGQVAIVATELGTNLVKHGREGVIVLRLLRSDNEGGVGILAMDSGPGMRDVRAVFGDGTSTTGTLGIGLGAVSRLATYFDVHSVPGRGTVVSASFWQRARSGSAVAGLTRTLAGESECGDAYAVRAAEDGWLLLSVDGLGHGPLAAHAAAAATRCFYASAGVAPGLVMAELHRGLARTRGAAAAVAHLDTRRRRLTYAAVGNISGRIVLPGRGRGGSRSLVTHPGIVGHNVRTTETTYDLEPGSWVVLHSDGLTEKWDVDDYPGILGRAPELLAATLMRDAAVRRDDASVLVAGAMPR